jgi:cytosine/adenosine deaminase-related metal-dependent hydrolase
MDEMNEINTAPMTATPLAPAHLSTPHLLLAPEHLLLPEGPVRGHGVLVVDDRFADLGPLDALQARHPGLVPLALPGKLVMPGFIDAHHHLTQAFGKALACGEPSEIYRRIWVPLEGFLDERLLYLSTKLAALEALRGGFTTVCDAGTRAAGDGSALAQAVSDAGLRCVLGLVCNDNFPDVSEQERAAIRERAEAHLTRFEHHPLVHPSLAISVPEVGTDRMLHDVARLCAEAGRVFQTHANEHLASVERSLVSRRLRPIEHLHQVGALGTQTLIAHATLVTPFELKLLADTGAAVSYNPVASAWKGNAVAPAELMAEFGIRVGLGTDGTRSDGFRLMDAAEAAQRYAFGLASGDSSCGAGTLWLKQATQGGADVLGLSALTGEIAHGKAADFLIVDLEVPEMLPSWDLPWDLVRLANRDQIEAVFVAGQLRLWQGWPLDWDGRALMREVAAELRQVVEQAPIQRIHGTSAEFAAMRRQLHGERAEVQA